MAVRQRLYESLAASAVCALRKDRPDVALTASFQAIACGAPCSDSAASTFEQALAFTGDCGTSTARRRLQHLMAAEHGISVPSHLSTSSLSYVEAHSLEVQRRLATLRVALSSENSHHRASFWRTLQHSYALSQLQRISTHNSLADGVSVWLVASLVQLAMNGLTTVPPTVGKCGDTDSTIAYRPLEDRIKQCLVAADVVAHQLGEIEHEVRGVSSQKHHAGFIEDVLRPIGSILHRRLLSSLFAKHIHTHRQEDAWTELPDALHRDPFPFHQNGCSVEQLIRRTMRDDVPRGVVIPDSRFLVDDFSLLLSLSQHREVVVTSRTLIEMVQEASPYNPNGQSRHANTKVMQKLLHSTTTDASVAEGIGGVTLVGPAEEWSATLSHSERHKSDESVPLVRFGCRVKDIFFRSGSDEEQELQAMYHKFRRQPRKYRSDPISKVVVASRNSEVRTQCVMKGLEVFP